MAPGIGEPDHRTPDVVEKDWAVLETGGPHAAAAAAGKGTAEKGGPVARRAVRRGLPAVAKGAPVEGRPDFPLGTWDMVPAAGSGVTVETRKVPGGADATGTVGKRERTRRE